MLSNMAQKRTVIVIGGGIAGVAAAYELRKHGCEVTILEGGDRLGGRVHSKKIGGVTSEMGASFLTNAYTNVLAFLREVGLDDQLIRRRSRVSIMRGGQQCSLTRATTVLGQSWLSWGAKLLFVWEAVRTSPQWLRLDMHDLWRANRVNNESVAEHFRANTGAS